MIGTFIANEIIPTFKIQTELDKIIEELIFDKDCHYFVFGKFSAFTDYCRNQVGKYRFRHNVRKIFFKSNLNWTTIEEDKFLDANYDRIYTPKTYTDYSKDYSIEREYELIKEADFIVFYNDNSDDFVKSLFEFAKSLDKQIINVYEIIEQQKKK